uniref:Uncharacterized protein n=1 Tax=viral metagenome TaxID=1070528 RepID=A0A6C0KL64_9ZZZZ
MWFSGRKTLFHFCDSKQKASVSGSPTVPTGGN